MGKKGYPYHEKLLHWIWKQRLFSRGKLQTTNNHVIIVHDPGRLNLSDGPDFTNAVITIGHLRWHGDVELHWNLSDWFAHRHQDDPNFQNVILHVVFSETDQMVTRADNSTIPTLCLSCYLNKPLQSFLQQYRQQPSLPCSGRFSFITEEAFAEQLAKAHREYFEQKIDDLLRFYDPELPLSEAWKKMLITGIFDGLGISHNRTSMRKLAAILYDEVAADKGELKTKALELSEIHCSNRQNFNWKHKGCRPGNHPVARIQQGADCLWHIERAPFQQWSCKDPVTLWKKINEAVTVTPSIGKERSSILFGTVFLPAIYLLGTLIHQKKLKRSAWDLWMNHDANIPDSLLQLFRQTKLTPELYSRKLGAIYQLREYCKPRNCQHCNVFKNIISS